LDGQGFVNTESVIYQDNQSEVLLGKHGERSSGKRIPHIDVQYDFENDQARGLVLTYK